MDRDEISGFVDTIEKEPRLEENNFDDSEEEDFYERYDDEHWTDKLRRKPLVIGGAVVLFIIIIVILFLPEKSSLSKADFNTLIERVDRIEARLTDVERIEEGNAAKVKGVATDMAAGVVTAQQLDVLAKKMEALEQKIGSMDERVQAIKPGTTGFMTAKKAQYHVVKRGESLYKIARQYGLTVAGLCKLNKINSRQSIHPGQRLLVSTTNG